MPGIGAALDAVGTSVALGTATSAAIDQLAYPNPNVLEVFGAALEPVERHSMALLTVLEYGAKQWEDDARILKINPVFWTAAATDFLPAIMDNKIGEALGLKQNETGSFNSGAQLAMMIAYSAIDVGERPFGDTGIRALFADASDLGRSYYAALRPQLLVDAGSDLGKLAVEYAGLLAYNQVMADNDVTATKGVFQYLKATANRAETLTVDLRASTWTKGVTAHTPSVRDEIVADLLSGIDAQSLARAEQWYGTFAKPGSTLVSDVDRISFALSAGLQPGGVPGAAAATGLALAVLSDGGNTANGGGGRDLIIGGTGDDIIYGGTGSDVLFGGGDPGNIWLAGGGNDRLYGGAGRDLLIAGEGLDELFGGDGADTFLFGGFFQAASFVGGEGNDLYDLRGSQGGAAITIFRGDGRDTLLTDADDFNFAALKFLPGEEIPEAPMPSISLYLPDYSLADVRIVWDISVTDTHPLPDRKVQLVHGHILIKDKISKALIFDMGEYLGTKTTFKGNNSVAYDFATPFGPRIHLSDGDFATIGDGVWPDMIVI